ncbi:hypothetical protein HNQ60_004530 [Povalibacter uvarum]|uniref:NYN domain-containing protein n=1 Tax=Povalibacter uvarum TaxID=732238 RepID=A0A841HTL5_9GAMM|nr:hypothetical protein [Povalibacter uvarum]
MQVSTMERTARLAVLVDAVNARASSIKELLAEVARYGTATVLIVYREYLS